MTSRTWKTLAICLLLLLAAGVLIFSSHERRQELARNNDHGSGVANLNTLKNAAATGIGNVAGTAAKPSTLNTNKLAYRLSNTTNSIRTLQAKSHAILLANALIDTEKPLDLKIPSQLRSSGDPGAYIVQARGQIDAHFRLILLSAGAQIVSYIPNNAYLVKIPASGAGALSGNSLVQAVLPYEPYYKMQSSLLGLAVNQEPLPPGAALTLGLFAADAATAEAQVEKLGAKVIGHDQSPFGPVLKVLAPQDWTTLAQSPVVQYMEPLHVRKPANDLSRVTVGISPDTTSPISSGYAVNGTVLTGNKVLVAVNDTGVDTNHPDFSLTGTAQSAGTVPPSRVTGLTYLDMVDTNGHGTHVAGIIAGNGSQSLTLSNIPEGSIAGADYRGKAPLANLFSMNISSYSDYQLQTNAAIVGAKISNNSWDYGSSDYDLAAASYDFATRDSVPFSTGSQPVLYVFAAGNDGGGTDDGSGGSGDTILSPGTAKNVITVGALEQLRNITNLVTTITPGTGTNGPTTNQIAYWQPKTDSSVQVADYSARGNVGIGIEGDSGRFKPDLVAPGNFVVSTSSQFNNEWNTNAYYNPTNIQETIYTNQVVSGSNGLVYFPPVLLPPEAVEVTITISTNTLSPIPFPTNLVIVAKQSGFPTLTSYDILSPSNSLNIPPDSGGAITGIQALQNNGFTFGVGNSNNFSVSFNVTVDVYTTNDVGDLYSVLEGMNDSLGGYYRYESGTSMAAADVSGVLALIQDYFTNQFQPAMIPSPALMKALLINGCRSVGNYELALTNAVNYQGWGLDNIGNSVPVNGLFNQADGSTTGSSFFVEQNPTNALATGDSHTYTITVNTNAFAEYLPLQATLVWTDPPGDPAAAIKLVNDLELVITNLDTGDVYFGNDIVPNIGFNLPWDTNGPPNIDTINNVQGILLQTPLASRYSVTVSGRSVNVNAVTAQVNSAAGQYAPNIVQDFALVVSVGAGDLPNAITVADNGVATNPTADQNFTAITTTNTPLMNQFVGASSPLLGTNQLPLGTQTMWGPNGAVTIGQTNQWHFYVVTNSGQSPDYTNAAFITFNVDTLSIPRMGVYEDNIANATKPEANIDMFVTDDPSIVNLNPQAISNCLAGAGNARASLANAGTQFVFYTNSVPGKSVYYIGIQAEDQMASEYDFLPIFTDIPFGGLDQNGNEIVNGLLLPMPIPAGSYAHPGLTNIFALAISPMIVEKVIVTNLIQHQNYGDLLGQLSFSGQKVVLNNHDGLGNTVNNFTPTVYDDTRNNASGTKKTDGPGSLVNFRGKSALGPWILTEMNNVVGLTGQVARLTLQIQPHRDLKQPGVIVSVPPGGWFIDYVDVPVGYTNLTFFGTNVTATGLLSPPSQEIQMYEKFGNEPTLTDYDQEATLVNGNPPGNSISVGPPLPQGQYFIGLYNPNTTTAQSVFLSATLGVDKTVNDIFNYNSSGPQPLLDDAVSSSVISVPNTVTQLIASVNVGLVVNSPRISDYAFTLVSPTGQRVLLMENRGGGDTNGAGMEFVYTNVLNVTATGGAAPNTNYLAVQPGSTVPITWNFYTVPDQMTVYDTTNAVLFNPNGADLLYNTGMTNNVPNGGGGAQSTIPVTVNVSIPAGVSNIAIIMNQFGNQAGGNGDAWFYTAGAPITNYEYLTFTDDTNLATVPIKFAEPPFEFTGSSTTFTLSDFDLAGATNYFAQTYISDGFGTGWTVPTNIVTVSTIQTNGQFVLVTNTVFLSNNLVSVVADSSVALGGDSGASNYLALGSGTITRSIPTVPGHIYNVTFWYRGPGISGWWRGEGNGTDSSDPENNNNNGALIGRFNFPAGEVGQAFGFQDPGNTYQFAGTNTYVQVPASPSLNVGAGGGFTVEGWINPTNLSRPQPLVEWLAHTNVVDTNLTVVQGPVLDQATGHFYYLLGATNFITSGNWAQQLGGYLVVLDSANENQWVYDTFTAYGTLNRDLWTGLRRFNGGLAWWYGGANFSAIVPYTNWVPGEPYNCAAGQFAAIMGPTNAYPGLWALQSFSGQTCGAGAVNPTYGVVEVPTIATNGVQFWISGTNWTPGETNTLQGCLYANIIDTNYVSHEIFSPPGLLTTNVFQHVALTYNTNSGIASLYLNGTNVATTNLGVFVPKTDGDMLIGLDMSRYTNNFYGGEMDEMSVYGRALSLAEISAIYQASAFATNGLIGKFDPATTPAASLAEALVTFGDSSNVIFGVNNQWHVNSHTFTATTNSMPLTISGIEPGILLDSFSVQEAPQTNLYYFPEQALSSLIGDAAAGNWTLQVWDSRVGAYVTNTDQLVSWQLSFVLESNAVIAAALPPETPVLSTVPAGETTYYSVTVPAWAHEATNILVSSSQPVDLLFFNTNNPPWSATAPDAVLLPPGSTSGRGSPDMAINPVGGQLQLQPGTTYYLGLRNSTAHAASATLEVDYDILDLTNGVPFADILTNEYQSVRYFSFDVDSNAYEATFQLLKLTANADLVVSKGAPLPTLTSDNYGSFNVSTVDENIYVLTNSSPVPLSAGRWYLGVVNRGTTWPLYSVLAKELDLTNAPVTNGIMPAIIDLTNGVPFVWTSSPGDDLTNFFHFHPTNAVVNGVTVPLAGLRFELFNMSGDGDLTLDTNMLPLSPPFFQSSQNGFGRPELIYVFTNNVLTNLATDWYLGVPSHEVTNISYSIVAEILTNSYFPAFPEAQGAGGGAIGGRGGDVYHVISTADSGPGTLRDAVTSATTNRTVVFDISGAISLTNALIITNSYLTIAGETAPGGGITVAGQMTTVTNAHDVVIRDVRFRRGAPDDSFQFINASNVIADHISAEWTSDNLVSVLNCSNVTVQWSIMADSLYNVTNFSASNPPTGSLLRQGNGIISFHHNLYADNYTGSPRLGDNLTLDFVNNVIYNWGAFSGLSGGSSDMLDFSQAGCTNRLNYICNYLIAGQDTATFGDNYAITNIAFFGGTTNALAANWIFQTNNFIDSDNNGVLNGANTGWAMFTNNYTPFGREFYTTPVSIDEAYKAYEKVLDFAGVNMAVRDAVDTNVINKVRYQTGHLVSTPPFSSMLAWWRGEGNGFDSVAGNNGILVGGLAFASGEVGQAFNFRNTNGYVFVPSSSRLNVGNYSGFTIEEWINPSNTITKMPLFGWGTNTSLVANSNILYGPILNTNNGHYYYLLNANTWSNSESIAIQLGGHLATIRSLAENLWVSNTFANYGGIQRNLWIGYYDPSQDSGGGHASNFTWVDGESVTFIDWASGEPNNCTGNEYWVMIYSPSFGPGAAGHWNDTVNNAQNCGSPGNATVYGVVEATNPPSTAPYLWTSVGLPGNLYANLLDSSNGSHTISSAAGLIQSNVYQHIAWTYDTNSDLSSLYINGALVASGNLGNIVPNTSGDIYLGKRIDGNPADIYSGGMDEVTIYKRALSQAEIQSIYLAGHIGKSASQFASALGALPFQDTDQDGLPDFWEATFTPAQLYVPSNNNDRNGDGYTDLEEYNNWLAVPHALTVTNMSVGIDLYQMFGESGHLAFFVTNSVHGQVYLTNVLGTFVNTSAFWSNTIAVFTPTNNAATNYYGYASFDCYVTNLDTAAYFGPVTVSVIVSAVQPPINSNMPPVITPLTAGVLDPTNTGGSDYYSINVTTNDYGAIFELDNASGPMALVVKKGALPSLSSHDYYTNAPPTNEVIVVLANSTPVPLSPGTWYMGAVNEAGIGSNVTYDVNVTLLQNIYAPVFLYPSNSMVFTNLETVPMTINCQAVDTNTSPLPLTYSLVAGPPGMTMTNSTLYWTPTETQGPSTNPVAVSVSNGAFAVTNDFSIIVEESNLPPVLPVMPNQLVIVPQTLMVTNTAADPDIPTNALGYTLYSTITGTNVPGIDTNGIITWAPMTNQIGTNYLFTTVVTDTNPWAVNAQSFSATNSFYVTVLASFPTNAPLTNIVAPNGINWYAVFVPTNAFSATNILWFASAPVTLWFSTNLPPSITNTADSILLSNLISGSSVLNTSLSTAPTNIIPGGLYFLGVQNTGVLPVTNAIEVDFGYLPPPGLTLPFIPTQVVSAGDTFIVTNTATDTNASAILNYILTGPAGSFISTNGIITWPTSTNIAPTNVVFTTVVNDVTDNLSATNSFAVIVLPGSTENQPATNVVGPHSINWFYVKVPANADIATNYLLFATAPLNLWVSTNVPPSVTNSADAELLANSMGGSNNLYTTSKPQLVPGWRYFVGLQNTNAFGVTNAWKVAFHRVVVQTNISFFSIVQTNIAGSNGFLLTWFAPVNDQFHVQWSPSLLPVNWSNFNGVVSASFITATNGEFQYFDDGSQTGGFGTTRFYRLLLLSSPTNTAPFFLYAPGAFYAAPTVPFTFTNSARDWDVPAQVLTYSVANTLAGTNVSINSLTGIISWTPDNSLLGQTNLITTTVFDNGIPPQGATNVFTVIVSTNTVAPAALFSSISVGTNSVKFQWNAPTNEQFQIRWTTNLAPAVWHVFPSTNTSLTGTFMFTDTNPLAGMKFYQLILLP